MATKMHARQEVLASASLPKALRRRGDAAVVKVSTLPRTSQSRGLQAYFHTDTNADMLTTFGFTAEPRAKTQPHGKA